MYHHATFKIAEVTTTQVKLHICVMLHVFPIVVNHDEPHYSSLCALGIHTFVELYFRTACILKNQKRWSVGEVNRHTTLMAVREELISTS